MSWNSRASNWKRATRSAVALPYCSMSPRITWTGTGTSSTTPPRKGRILRNQTADDAAVLNADDAQCRALRERVQGSVVWFAAACRDELDACACGNRILFRGKDVASTSLPIPGLHNLENALAAVAACSLAGVQPSVIGAALRSFKPVPHRMEFVGNVCGVKYYNDSKATNVAAALKACGSFASGLWTILGGRDKGSDYRPLGSVLRGRSRAALLIGEAAPLLREQLHGSTTLIESGTLAKAVGYARAHADRGDTVLLAPACASHDQFPDYIERGNTFRRLVKELGS